MGTETGGCFGSLVGSFACWLLDGAEAGRAYPAFSQAIPQPTMSAPISTNDRNIPPKIRNMNQQKSNPGPAMVSTLSHHHHFMRVYKPVRRGLIHSKYAWHSTLQPFSV